MLDGLGGTDIVAILPRYVTFTHGLDHLACMSLSEGGTLRWYTSCCKTPVGNTPRDVRQSHVGLVHNCLEAQGTSLDHSFGPVTMRIHTKSAKRPPSKNSPLVFTAAVLRYMASLTWSRVSGEYRVNPFFHPSTGAPAVAPRVLSESERAALLRAV
jgi:hypothetical protein